MRLRLLLLLLSALALLNLAACGDAAPVTDALGGTGGPGSGGIQPDSPNEFPLPNSDPSPEGEDPIVPGDDPEASNGQYDGPPISPAGQNADCEDLGAACNPGAPRICEPFEVGTQSRPVDIVFAVDQSGSMDESIQAIQSELNAFAAYITTLSVDFHVIVVASLSEGNKLCIPEPLAGPNCGDGDRFHAVDSVVGSHNALDKIQSNIADIESFIRPNSLRHFVVVTDDNANGVGGPSLHQFLTDRPGYEDYQFHGILGLAQSWCTEEEGEDYVWLVETTGGLLFDLCFAEWDWLFVQLGEELSLTLSQFPLSEIPLVYTLEVFQEGEKLPYNDGWGYDDGLNLVELTGVLPPSGTVLEICYVPAATAPETEAPGEPGDDS